jgi:hypothetical protein
MLIGGNDMEHIVVGSLFVVIIVVAGWLILFYSNMTNKKALVETSWQLLFSQLQRRNEVVKSYIETASQLKNPKLEFINQFITASSGCINSQIPYDVMTSILETNKLIENFKTENEFYLDADDNLNSQLSQLEMSIDKYRELYNQRVLNYNMFLTQFPNNVACRILGVQKLPQIDGFTIIQEK